MGEGNQRERIDLHEPYYIQRLAEINASEMPILNINLAHIKQFKNSLYKTIVAYPAVSILFDRFKSAFRTVFRTWTPL
jgi:hypothetical protein